MSKKMSITNHVGAIKSYFPDGKIHSSKDKLTWVGNITPTPLSETYEIKVTYSYSDGVKIYVVNPKPLPLASSQERLPHVYSHEKQQICLYYPNGKEWNNSQYLVHTIFPWASEWLMYYELWLATGTWLGGGRHINEEEKVKEGENETE
jgi:hypothetical protein